MKWIYLIYYIISDFLITSYIYENCGNLNPGALTDLRSALVNNIIFACLTVRHGLHVALLSYTPELNNTIERFVKFQEDRNFAVNDEVFHITERNTLNIFWIILKYILYFDMYIHT